jgi:DNA replication protein DnaC
MPADTLEMMLRGLFLPTFAARFTEMIELAEAQNWGYRKLLLQLCEAEAADRRERKQIRLLRESKLPSGKTLGNLDESQLPAKVRRQMATLLEGGFIERAENLLAFGLPGRGKTHFLCALGRELILRHGYSIHFTPTFKLVQQLLIAKKDLKLDGALKKLDCFDAIILDDIGYVQQSREEMEVLFTFLADRYERRSLMVSSNLVFSKWDQIFKDPMTTMAAVDRLVHHAIILEFDGESMRAQQRNRTKPSHATTIPFGSAPSLAPPGAKDYAPPKGMAKSPIQHDSENINNDNQPGEMVSFNCH